MVQPVPSDHRWPAGIGVGGVSVPAARTGGAGRPHRCLAAVRSWMSAVDIPGTAGDPSAASGFPFRPVLEHYQTVGRSHVDPELCRRLRRIRFLLGTPPPGDRERWWPLVGWLPSTVDQGVGDYDSYLVADLVEHTAPDADTTDRLIRALAADLVRLEAEALRTAGPDRRQCQRVRACLLLLSRVAELLPDRDGPQVRVPAPGEVRDGDLVGVATDRAEAVGATVPDRVRAVVDLAMLPTTPLHDERMFVRTLQAFEALYRRLGGLLADTRDALRRRDPTAAHAGLAEVTRLLRLSPVLFRVVTTMPPEVFAVIREYTTGRSAVQSRAYRRIECLGAPRDLSAVADKVAVVTDASPSIEETFLAVRDRIDPVEARRLVTAMRCVDADWRAMKRTHWGITLKIIGTVPGTGGTAGAEYLRRAAETPLFPFVRDGRAGGRDE